MNKLREVSLETVRMTKLHVCNVCSIQMYAVFVFASFSKLYWFLDSSNYDLRPRAKLGEHNENKRKLHLKNHKRNKSTHNGVKDVKCVAFLSESNAIEMLLQRCVAGIFTGIALSHTHTRAATHTHKHSEFHWMCMHWITKWKKNE